MVLNFRARLLAGSDGQSLTPFAPQAGLPAAEVELGISPSRKQVRPDSDHPMHPLNPPFPCSFPSTTQRCRQNPLKTRPSKDRIPPLLHEPRSMLQPPGSRLQAASLMHP